MEPPDTKAVTRKLNNRLHRQAQGNCRHCLHPDQVTYKYRIYDISQLKRQRHHNPRNNILVQLRIQQSVISLFHRFLSSVFSFFKILCRKTVRYLNFTI